MDAFFAAVRRTFRQDGESVLERAVSGLEKAKTRLYAAAVAIDNDVGREEDGLSEERVRFRLLEVRTIARVATLKANYYRAVRVAGKISDLVG